MNEVQLYGQEIYTNLILLVMQVIIETPDYEQSSLRSSGKTAKPSLRMAWAELLHLQQNSITSLKYIPRFFLISFIFLQKSCFIHLFRFDKVKKRKY